MNVSSRMIDYSMLRPLYNSDRMDQLVLPLNLPVADQLWRPIHYLGSKLRLVDSIRRQIAELGAAGDTVCDLFAGSGTVAMSLAPYYKVIASDIQEYSRVLCSALLRPTTTLNDALVQDVLNHAGAIEADLESSLAPILELESIALTTAGTTPSLLCDLAEQGSLLAPRVATQQLAKALSETNLRLQKQSQPLLATKYFGGTYFSYRQAFQLDCLLNATDDLPAETRDSCLAAVLSTASTIVNSVGKQFAQPMRPRRKDGTIKTHLVRQMCRDRSLDVFTIYSDWLLRYRQLSQTQGHRVVHGDYRDVLRELRDVAVVYADPPYTRDHYSRFYHVLETLSLRDSPSISTTLLTGKGNASRGIYREDRHQSPFCIKSQAPKAFDELFRGCSKLGADALVSYSPFLKEGHPRLMTVDAVEKIAKEYYRHVRAETAQEMAHSKLNKTELHLDASANAEVFIVCQN